MNERTPDHNALDRLADALVDDVLRLSDQDILDEAREAGEDLDQLAADMLALFENARERVLIDEAFDCSMWRLSHE